MELVVIRDTNLGLGEWAAANDPSAVLVCLGLGSCVAFVAYDAQARIGGMAHMVLPESAMGRVTAATPAKFVDLAIPLLLREMQALGARRERLRLTLVGGARMLQTSGIGDRMNIGDRNVQAARAAIATLGLRPATEDVGGGRGRTVRLTVASGELTVKTASGSSRLAA